MEIEGIIFDLDGTLWSSIDSCVKVLHDIKNKYPEVTKEIDKEEIERNMGKSFDEIVECYYGYIDKERAITIAKDAFESNVRNLMKNGGTLYPKLEETLKELSKKYKLFIVSNCIKGYIESFLNTSGLKEYFIDYESNGNTGLVKGENIKIIMNRNNIKKAIYVGDTESDRIAANYANIPFVYAKYGFGNVDEYDYVIDEISDLCKIDLKGKTNEE